MRPIFAFFGLAGTAPLAWLLLTLAGFDAGFAGNVVGGITMAGVVGIVAAMGADDRRRLRLASAAATAAAVIQAGS
jgi:p-aminobenzoyl-glutamate transporter AbgT